MIREIKNLYENALAKPRCQVEQLKTLKISGGTGLASTYIGSFRKDSCSVTACKIGRTSPFGCWAKPSAEDIRFDSKARNTNIHT
jgi:hypothetical protein